ncbi:hypothetical protein AK812_SmicGene47666 [Symbiodinium microadriaticum]|uniref:Uncharacterized protein n=1 Tax=Symbiodinium microadriaticum TaxID=2951 RepID=A0A1Q9BR62_SYMMI|nr:hypothetical protein AK812_SmicGene47666 [Symbiodinium microadriaticum]
MRDYTCCSRRLHTDLRLYLALNKSSAITSAFNPPAMRRKDVSLARSPRPGLREVVSTERKKEHKEMDSEADRRLPEYPEFRLILAASLARKSNWTTP